MSVTAIGNRVRQLRRDRNLSQTALAKKIGFSQSAVARLEADENYRGSAEMITALADYFQCDKDWLETGKGEQVSAAVVRKLKDAKRKSQKFVADLPLEVREAIHMEPFAKGYFHDLLELLERALRSRVPLADSEEEEFFQFLLKEWARKRQRGDKLIRDGIELLGHVGFAELAKHMVNTERSAAEPGTQNPKLGSNG